MLALHAVQMLVYACENFGKSSGLKYRVWKQPGGT